MSHRSCSQGSEFRIDSPLFRVVLPFSDRLDYISSPLSKQAPRVRAEPWTSPGVRIFLLVRELWKESYMPTYLLASLCTRLITKPLPAQGAYADQCPCQAGPGPKDCEQMPALLWSPITVTRAAVCWHCTKRDTNAVMFPITRKQDRHQ